MSTCATITVADENASFDIYQHHDGYPDGPFGLVRHIAMARRLAWDLPRFQAADFAAAVIAMLKDRGGSTYLTEDASPHTDRDFHYRIESIREDYATRVLMTITRPGHKKGQADLQVFSGEIEDAVTQFDAAPETADQPRENQILRQAEETLCRAQEEINALCGERPDSDTETVHENIEDTCRTLMLLRNHLETMSPWRALKQAGETNVDARLAWQAHLRFQRE